MATPEQLTQYYNREHDRYEALLTEWETGVTAFPSNRRLALEIEEVLTIIGRSSSSLRGEDGWPLYETTERIVARREEFESARLLEFIKAAARTAFPIEVPDPAPDDTSFEDRLENDDEEETPSE